MKLHLSFMTTLFLLASAGTAISVRGQNDVGCYRAIQEPINMPSVQVPEEAIKSGLGGTVKVPVIVDLEGTVVKVLDPSGPGAICKGVTRPDVITLRSAAKDVAKLAKFAPIQDAESLLSEAWVTVVFPSSLKDQTLPAATEDSIDDKSQPSGKNGKKKPEKEKYTIVGDATYSTTASPESVNNGGQGILLSQDAKTGGIQGGVLNGKATNLPKPPYPAAALAIRASGAVSIQVLIDTDGQVFSAEAVSGHPLPRTASANAACEAKFSPTLLSGTPVKVYGVIVYNFLP